MNKKMIFSFCMCAIMVTGMTYFNMTINSSFSFTGFCKNFAILFFIAYFIDAFFVNKIVKKITDAANLKHKLAFPCLKVCGMVLLMSFFGIVVSTGLNEHLNERYLNAIWKNYPVALSLQILIAAPFAKIVTDFSDSVK